MDSTNKLEDSMLKIRFVFEEKLGINKLEDSMLKIRFVIEEKHGLNKLERYNAHNTNVR